MFLKRSISLVLCMALLLIVSTLAFARGGGQGVNQTGMETPTPVTQPESTPIPGLPLAGADTSTCPMMSGTGMSGTMSGMAGMNMLGMSGTGGMSGMSGMTGMQGMSGSTNMGTMPGMNMTGVNAMPMNLTTPWYSNPWLLLGWVLVTLVVLAVLVGSVYGVMLIVRRSRPSQPANIS